jgi:hypothetical protein
MGRPIPEATLPTLQLHDPVHLLEVHPDLFFETEMGPGPAVTKGLLSIQNGPDLVGQIFVQERSPCCCLATLVFIVGRAADS